MLSHFFNIKKMVAIGCLLIAAFYTTWLTQQKQHEKPANKSSIEHPDFFGKNIYGIEFDENGHVYHEMFTPYLLHFPKNNAAFITKPHIVIYSPKEPEKKPWHITANKGETTEGTAHIILNDNVLIHQPPGKINSELRIKTEQLFVASKTSIAESPKQVTFTEPGITVNSLGMRAFLKEKRVILLSQAKGVYDASQVEKKSH